MKCSRCNTENRDEARYCSHCGHVLGRTCSVCGKISASSAAFCDDCGHTVHEATTGNYRDTTLHHPCTVPRQLAEKILSARDSVEGERKLVTALFADVANFTSMSEVLDTEDVHDIMDECFKLLIDRIHAHEGTVVQFTGDGVMALFGAPIAHEDHCQRACYAALAIQHTMRDFTRAVQTDYGIEFAMRVGINSGYVVVGSIGDDLRMDYTAIGDTINLASRMEKIATPGSIFVSGNSFKLSKTFFHFNPMGTVAIRGKRSPVSVYELVKPGEAETRIAAAAIRGLTRFVGRERELQSLKKTFEKVRSRAGQVVGVVGEAGVGKSRLLLEFKNSLGNMSCYLEGRCLHYGISVAYLPVIDIIKSYFGIHEGMSERMTKTAIDEGLRKLDHKLLTIRTPLYDLLSLTLDDDTYLRLEPKARRDRIFEAVRDLFVRESQISALVITFEDLHWIDKTTEEFLSYFIKWIPNTSILLVLLYRPDYVHAWGSKSYYSRIGLGLLPTGESAEMVKFLLGGGDVSPELNEFIIGRTGGNPLFMEELTYELIEAGYIVEDNERYRLTRQLWEIEVPDSIHGIIAARMDRLEAKIKQTMQMAAVIGKEFNFTILEKISEPKEDLKRHLLELQSLEFVYEESLFPDLEYTFKHWLIQEVAYNSLLLKKRKQIHEKIGQAIEELSPERIEEFCEVLAFHYVKGENRKKAYTFLKASGVKATRSSSLWEAFRFFRDAVGILKRDQMDREVKQELIEVTLLMISSMISLGFPEDSLYILQYAESLCREIDDTKSLTTLCSVIGLYFSVKGDTMRGLQYNEKCFEVARATQDINLMAPVVFDLCSNYASRGEFLKIIDMAPGILASLEESGKESESFGRGYNIYSALSAFYGFAIAYIGDNEGGRSVIEKGLTYARELENLYCLGLIELFIGYTYCNQGDGETALIHFEKSIPYLENGQIFVLLGLAWSGVGWSHYYMGKPEVALQYIEKGLQIHSDANINYNLSVHYWFLSMVHCDLGNLEKANSYIDEALRVARVNHEIYYIGLATITNGRILGKEGKYADKAVAEIIRGMDILRDLRVKPQIGIGHLLLAEVYGGLKQTGMAIENLQSAMTIFQETKMTNWLRRTEAAIAAFRGP